jgi:hypothetical protein
MHIVFESALVYDGGLFYKCRIENYMGIFSNCHFTQPSRKKSAEKKDYTV